MKVGTKGTGGLVHGYWAVCFLDLLGQQEAFLRTDHVPDKNDPAAVELLTAAIRESLGVVRLFHDLSGVFRAALVEGPDPSIPTELRESIAEWKARKVSELRWSDGIVLYTSLARETEHVPIMALYDMMMSAASMMFILLARGSPLRGGIDVGTGIETDGQLFGAGLVKAYRLESKVAQHPRIVVGPTLVDYLEAAVHVPGDSPREKCEQQIARRLRAVTWQDEDGQWILDYVGQAAIDIFGGTLPPDLLQTAKDFIDKSRDHWREQKCEKLFERYSRLARYFDRRTLRL